MTSHWPPSEQSYILLAKSRWSWEHLVQDGRLEVFSPVGVHKDVALAIYYKQPSCDHESTIESIHEKGQRWEN